MPTITEPVRDAQGRFAGSRRVETGKTPVLTVQDASAAVEHLSRIMNEVARDRNLCSSYEEVILKLRHQYPQLVFADENSGQPKWYIGYSVSGRVYAPADRNGNDDTRANGAVILNEYRQWAQEHALDVNLQGTFMAWVDTLPENRRRPNGGHSTFNYVAVDNVTYHEESNRSVRTRTMRLRTEPAPTPAPTTTPDIHTPPTVAANDPSRWVIGANTVTYNPNVLIQTAPF